MSRRTRPALSAWSASTIPSSPPSRESRRTSGPSRDVAEARPADAEPSPDSSGPDHPESSAGDSQADGSQD